MTAEHPLTESDVEALAEWRERIGERLMYAMTCNHGADYFGSGAVCETCFANVQRIGRIIERIRAEADATGAEKALREAHAAILAVSAGWHPEVRRGFEKAAQIVADRIHPAPVTGTDEKE